jgi:hypothetical protein
VGAEPDVDACSPEWFARALDAAARVQLPPDRACRVQFDVDGARSFLTVDGGRVTAWELGSADGADVELRWTRDHARQIARGELRGNDALRATTVAAATADGTYVGTPAPLNLRDRHELTAMPTVPGATFTAQYRYRDGPFGDVHYVLAFEDGRFVDERLEQADGSDVQVDVTYRAMALVRAGDITILDALENGTVNGELGPLATLAGISESPEFHDAEVATGRHAVALSVLGELAADPTFAAAMARIVASTRWA